MHPWRVFTPVVADSHHFDEDLDSHLNERLDLDSLLKVLSSEMDPVEIRLIASFDIKGSVAAGF